MAGIIGAVIAVVVVFYSISVHNKLTKFLIKVNEAQAGIEIALIKRYDVLTQSWNIAKQYAAHESSLMISLIQVRNGMTPEQIQQVLDNQSDAMQRICAIGEAYPQLASSELYRTVQHQIAEVNEHVSASKRLYNSNVSVYNQAQAVFPANVVATVTGKRQVPFLRDENIGMRREVNLV